MPAIDKNAQLKEEIHRLKANIVVLKADKFRLDFLDQPWVTVHRFPKFEWTSYRTDIHKDSRTVLSPHSLREAIDIEMARIDKIQQDRFEYDKESK